MREKRGYGGEGYISFGDSNALLNNIQKMHFVWINHENFFINILVDFGPKTHYSFSYYELKIKQICQILKSSFKVFTLVQLFLDFSSLCSTLFSKFSRRTSRKMVRKRKSQSFLDSFLLKSTAILLMWKFTMNDVCLLNSKINFT
jgi:hypothetical protein